MLTYQHLCIFRCVFHTSVHAFIWCVYEHQCLCAYDVKSEPSCWSAARPIDVWSSGCKRKDESVSFRHFLSLSHSGNQMDSLLFIILSVLTSHNFLSPFFCFFFYIPASLSAVLTIFPCFVVGCITKYSPTNPEFHYEPLTHADNVILQQTDRLWIRSLKLDNENDCSTAVFDIWFTNGALV